MRSFPQDWALSLLDQLAQNQMHHSFLQRGDIIILFTHKSIMHHLLAIVIIVVVCFVLFFTRGNIEQVLYEEVKELLFIMALSFSIEIHDLG